MSLQEIDREIAQIEARLAAQRVALDDAVTGCTNSLRDTVASPKTWLALAGVGFAVGKMMFKPKHEPVAAPATKKAGLLGLLTGIAGTALGMMQSRGVGTIARWGLSRAIASRKAAAEARARAASTTVTRPPPFAAPPVRTTTVR